MPQFKYRAVNEEGEAFEDVMEAASARQAAKRLRERGLTVNSVELLHSDKRLLRVSSQLTWEEISLLTEQLQAIARGGFPMASSLHALAQDLNKQRLKPVLEGMSTALEQGASLEEAIGRYHESFPRVYAALIRAGESTGNLPGVLQLLSAYAGRMVRLKQGIKVALAYPIMVTIVSIFILWFILVKVVPVFAEIFRDFGGQLPAPTQFYVNLGNFFAYHGITFFSAMCVTIMLLYIAGRLMWKNERGRCWMDAIRIHVPMLGRLIYLASVARFARTFSLLLEARVPVLESLELAAAAAGSPLIERAAESAVLDVAGGDTIADALRRTKYFGHSFCWLLGLGEKRGEAEVALLGLADAYDREADMRDRIIATLFTPALVVMLGLIIGSLVISLYLPIFTLGDIVH